MSLVEEMHAAHKARLERLGRPQPTRPTIDQDQHKIIEAKLSAAQATIAELEDLVAQQRKIIRSFAGNAPTINDVMMVVSEHYDMPEHVMVGTGRSPSLTFPRYVAYFLCREFGYSLHQIGNGFKRDHTTAYYGAYKASIQAGLDPDFADLLRALKAKAIDRAALRVNATMEALS